MLDLGSGVLGPLQKVIQLSELDGILLSSLSVDHCADLAGLFIALSYAPAGPYKIAVYGPPGTSERLVDICGPEFRREIPRVYSAKEWNDQAPVTIGPLTIRTRRMNHPKLTYGLRVESAQAAVVYTGDTDTCPALTALASKADVLLAEATFEEHRDRVRDIHLTGHRAGVVAAEANVGRLVLTHLPVWTNRDVVLAEAMASFAGPVEIAEPYHIYDI